MQFEEEFDRLLASQIRTADGQRLEMLRKDKTGEKKLYCEVLRPVLPSLHDLIMEHEITSMSGVRIYLDFYIPSLRWAPECVGFVPHAQNITRERFDFEQMRIRTMAAYRIQYIPFAMDELKSSRRCAAARCMNFWDANRLCRVQNMRSCRSLSGK